MKGCPGMSQTGKTGGREEVEMGRKMDLPNGRKGVKALCSRPWQSLLLDGVLDVTSCHIDSQSVSGNIRLGVGFRDIAPVFANDHTELDWG